MKTTTTLLLMCLFVWPTILSSQDLAPQKQIDEDVWIPFAQSYSDFDAEIFNSLHSEDITRINSKGILSPEVYKKKNTDWFTRAKAEGYRQSIILRFEKRLITDDRAFEVGYYKIHVRKPDGEELDYYARFHVMLEQQAGTWKIVQDWDSNVLNGKKVSAADFDRLAAEPEVSDTKEATIVTMSLVKILEGRKEEALFYFENNWKELRKKAVERGYIASFNLLVNEAADELGYDLVLSTTYANKEQYDLRESHFETLIEEHQDGGILLKNEWQPADFRKTIKSITLHEDP